MNKKLILQVEDDPRVQIMNEIVLEGEGFAVVTAATLAEAWMFIKKENPSAVILDRGMPDGDGLDFLRKLRESSRLPVLMLTGYMEDADIMSGYDNGCDDYVTKPASSDVLLKKLKRLLENAERVPETITRGLLTLKPIPFEAYVNGEDLGLTPNEYKLLQFFVQNENRDLTAEYIYETVWGKPLGEDTNPVRKTISKLRKKLLGCGYTISNEYGGEYKFERGEP